MMVLMLLSTQACAIENFDHSRFYLAKSRIKQELIETTKEVGLSATELEFKTALEKRLVKVVESIPELDYTVLTSTQENATIVITLIGYTDKKGYVGWKFDTVLVDDNAYFFSATLADREIPELKAEEYYRWNQMKKESMRSMEFLKTN